MKKLNSGNLPTITKFNIILSESILVEVKKVEANVKVGERDTERIIPKLPKNQKKIS